MKAGGWRVAGGAVAHAPIPSRFFGESKFRQKRPLSFRPNFSKQFEIIFFKAFSFNFDFLSSPRNPGGLPPGKNSDPNRV